MVTQTRSNYPAFILLMYFMGRPLRALFYAIRDAQVVTMHTYVHINGLKAIDVESKLWLLTARILESLAAIILEAFIFIHDFLYLLCCPV